MATALTGLRLARLKELCLNCGVSHTGAKAILAERLLLAPRVPVPAKILSIDMGVKNLAYCELSINDKDDVSGGGRTFIDRPRVSKWSLVDLPSDVSYEQPEFAQLAIKLLSHFNEMPPVVLIEKQRMRSRGLSNVPEWISRVNLLEAMIHALIQSRIASGEIISTVFSIPPAKVMQYWIRADPAQSSDHNKRYRLTKKAKVDLVDSWLEQHNGAHSPVQFCHSDGSGDETALNSVPHGKKRDDLSDALLQGLAWIRWQRNLTQIDTHLKDRKALDSGEELEYSLLTHGVVS